MTPPLDQRRQFLKSEEFEHFSRSIYQVVARAHARFPDVVGHAGLYYALEVNPSWAVSKEGKIDLASWEAQLEDIRTHALQDGIFGAFLYAKELTPPPVWLSILLNIHKAHEFVLPLLAGKEVDQNRLASALVNVQFSLAFGMEWGRLCANEASSENFPEVSLKFLKGLKPLAGESLVRSALSFVRTLGAINPHWLDAKGLKREIATLFEQQFSKAQLSQRHQIACLNALISAFDEEFVAQLIHEKLDGGTLPSVSRSSAIRL